MNVNARLSKQRRSSASSNTISTYFSEAGLPAIGQSVKLITCNIHLELKADGENAWKFTKDFLAARIRFHAPDVFGVQEVLQGQVE